MIGNPSHMVLDWLLVVSGAFSVLLAIVYLFYSNRLLALLVGYLLHLSWWNDGSNRAWVSLESFQLSLLAGRIMIKDLTYHSSNQSFRAIKCHITWRYWFWRTRRGFGRQIGEEGGCGNAKASKLPSRFHLSLEGVEWRLYNRTAAYNDMLTRLQSQSNIYETKPNGYSPPVPMQSQGVTASGLSREGSLPQKTNFVDGDSPSTPVNVSYSRFRLLKESISSWFTSLKLDFREILPIEVTAVRGAIVFGNPSTQSLLVAKFSKGQGSYGIVPSRSLHDRYKTIIDGKFQDVRFDLERNGKYRGSLLQHGRIASRYLRSDPVSSKLSFSDFTRLWDDIVRDDAQQKMDDTFRKSEAELVRENSDYAIVETILETPRLELMYYWDTPGVVPSVHQKESSEGLEPVNVGNGDLAPQYGIDLVIYGGIARYGPWADRQRVELQRLFFPPTFQTVKPTAILKPGDTRIYTALKLFIELRDTITFHIPFKEPSKDWQYDESKFPGSTRKRREGGWLELHAGGNSTISYVLPWVATQDGYDTLLELHLDDVNVLSSVNDMRLLKAESSRVLCDLPTPLRWNDPRRWLFNVSFQTPTFHVIRDHVNLLTDLGKDWSSGPPHDFNTWIPMHYVVNASFQKFETNLYLNDQNIITHPHARDANTLLTLRGGKVQSSVEIPSTVFRPQYTTVPFWIDMSGVSLSLTLPKWNTRATFASSRTTDFGHMGSFRIDGSFLYYSTVLPEYIDQLKLDITGRDAVQLTLGWIIRHGMSLRENYIGNFTNFSTLTEYVTKRDQNLPIGDPVEWKWREGKSNVFEVLLSIHVERSVMVFPAGLPGYEFFQEQLPNSELHPNTEAEGEFKGLGTCAIMHLPEWQLQLRTHDYSMEVSLNINPFTISVVNDLTHNLVYETYQTIGQQKLQIDGINILANRLFGPQPRTSAYLCLWEFQVGAVAGIASTKELQGLLAAMTSVRSNFIDALDAPAREFTMLPEPDVTFLKLSLKSLDMAWGTDQTSVQLYFPQGIKIDYNDLAGTVYKKVTEIRLPQAVVRALVSYRKSWLEAASISFDIGASIYSSPSGWREASEAQMAFVTAQDALTRRAWFLYETPSRHNAPATPSAHQMNMFLPKPVHPSQSSRGHILRDQRAFTSQKSGSRASRHKLSESVDSDGDECISEADRDARLAHSRPDTPLTYKQDDDDSVISSADESDDGDNTNGDFDSDSDVNDQDHFNVGNEAVSPLSHYKNIVRRFESHFDGPTSSWISPLFTMICDATPSTDAFPTKAVPRAVPDVGPPLLEDFQDSKINTVVRLVRSKDIDVLVTPLCVHVLEKVIDELVHSTISLELVVDSLTQEYLGDNASERTVDTARKTLDAEILSIRLRILQNLVAVDDTAVSLPTGISSQNIIPPMLERSPRIVSDMIWSLSGLTASFSEFTGSPHITSNSKTFCGSLSQVDVCLDMSVLDEHSHKNATPEVSRQCRIAMDSSEGVAALDVFYVKLGDMRMRFLGERSPEVVAATLDSLISITHASKLSIKRIANLQASRQHQILNILQSCRGISVRDSLNQIQPSFLVQFGRPGRLRRDLSWKLFRYLRHCLRHRNVIVTPADAFSITRMDDLLSVLHEILSDWGFELSRQEMASIPFLQYCFPGMSFSVTEKPQSQRDKFQLSFYSGSTSFTVLERPTSSHHSLGNTFSIGPLRLIYRCRHQKITTLPGKVAGISTFLSESDSPPLRHNVLSAVTKDVCLTIHPSFITFLQRLIPLHKKYFRQTSNDSPVRSRKFEGYWECFLQTQQISVQAAVEGMVLEIGMDNISFVTPFLQGISLPWARSRLRQVISGKSLLKFSQVYMRVRQAHDKTDPFSTHGRDVLTSLTFTSVAIDTCYRTSGEHSLVLHGLLALDSILLSVPRSALLTYRLIEEWRTQYLPNIYAMTRDLLAELSNDHQANLSKRQTFSVKRSLLPIIDLQTSVKRVGVTLQVMHGTWFSWDVNDMVGFLRSGMVNTRNSRFTLGAQLASQIIRIGAKPGETPGKVVKSIKLALPAIRASGDYDGIQLRTHAIIDQFSLTLKPKYMDDILVVQQNLGTHFYDVLDLIAEGRKNRPMPKQSTPFSIKYTAAFMLEGFRIGIEGPTTTLALTSAKITGASRNENGLAWDFAVSNLALALSHRLIDTRPRVGFDRSLRSAYMVLDVNASSSSMTTSPDVQSSNILRLHVSRMHAVMSPNSIGELADLIDHVQAEKHLRQEQRALELEEIKNKTKRVMRTFELQKPTTSLKRSTSFLDNRTVLIDIADIGIAFPLALKNEIAVDAIGSVPAFLMSIKMATFFLKRYESGQASMKGLSFQFVKQFDQSDPSQFDGDQHKCYNMLLYPGMKAEFRTGTNPLAQRWQVAAHVDGFILDLDPAIVDNVFSLIDVYHKGRERIDRLTVNPRGTKLDSRNVAASVEASYLAIRTSGILVTLVFHTGKLRLRSRHAEDESVTRSTSTATLEANDDKPDEIEFPTIAVWGEYRATPPASRVCSPQDQEPSVLIFRSQVHSTTNRIQPSILPFLIGFVERIEICLRNTENSQGVLTATTPSSSETSSADDKEFLAPSVLNDTQLSFSLRIDSSRLELDCGYDIGVVAALHWESGGFLVTLSPQAGIVYFAGSVTGLQVDLRHLKHQAGTVQTAHVDARNLAFSLSYSQTDSSSPSSHKLSMVLDTEFGAALRFDRLQDILIFKAVYIDRLPGGVHQTSKPAVAENKSPQKILGLTTLLLIRARHIKLHADLGHNVAAAVIDLDTTVFRSRVAGSVTDLSLSIAHVTLDLEEDRQLGGFMRLPNFSFATVRRSDVQLVVKDAVSGMLDVVINSGALDIVLQSEKRIILQYHAKPFDIRIADDWSAIDWNILPEERSLRLDFSVVGEEILAVANLQSIPKIINLLSKLRSDLHLQQSDASNALATSSIAQLPKPESTLSAVAEAMIRSARSKFGDGPAFSFTILQRMKLKLSSLRLALFKTPNDLEMALFQGKEVSAELERIVHSFDTPPSRSLKLSFSSLYLSKYASLKYRAVGNELMAVPWLERLLKGASEWTIARVPAMNLEMNSDVEYEGQQEVLYFDLVATPDDRAQSSSSIYVSLNLSLYIWAGALVKGLGLEIERALVSSGFNTPTGRAPMAAITSPSTSAPQPPSLDVRAKLFESVSPTSPTSPYPFSQAFAPPPTPVTMTPHESDIRPPRKYHARSETSINYGNIQQLGEATPDAKAPWLGLKETVPPRVHEYATLPMEVMMKILLEIYSKQLKRTKGASGGSRSPNDISASVEEAGPEA